MLKLIFVQICAVQWTKVKWCFERVFYHFKFFGLKNAKIPLLKKISSVSAVFIELKCMCLPTHLADTNKTLIFVPFTDFFRFFEEKNLIFCMFIYFENLQLHIQKSLYVFYFM